MSKGRPIIVTYELHNPKAEAQRLYDLMHKPSPTEFHVPHVVTEEEIRAERRAAALDSRLLATLLDACEKQPLGALDHAAFTIVWPSVQRP